MIHCIMIMMSNKNNCSLLSCDCPFCPSSNQRWTSNVGWFHLAFIFHAYYTLLLCFLHVCTPNSHKKCFYQLSILQYFNNHFLFLKIRHTICFLPTTEHSSVHSVSNTISNIYLIPIISNIWYLISNTIHKSMKQSRDLNDQA